MDSEFRLYKAVLSKTRREEVDDDEFLVVPMVALRTGVYQCANCPEPEFYDVNIFARQPESWNDRPATLGHPKRKGVYVSAGSQDVWKKDGLGRIRNARRSGEKLLLEAWIDIAKAEAMGAEAIELVDALEAGEPIDVSVGAFNEAVKQHGSHQGREYKRTQKAWVPDHVAFLPGQEGACNWEDGCGAPRVNQADIEDDIMQLQVPTTDTSTLALAANHRHESACSCGGNGGECACAGKVEMLAGSLDLQGLAVGDDAKRRILSEAVRQKVGEHAWSSVLEVFEDTIVYQTSSGTFRRDYTLSNDGTVTLSDDPVQGALVAEFMPITVQQEKDQMTERKDAVDGLIANEAAPWAEDDRDFLMGASDAQFEKLTADASADEETFPEVSIDAAQPAEKPAAEQFMASAPAEVREVLAEGMAERRRARAELIGKVKENGSNAFTDAELDAMSSDHLRKLAALSFTEANEGRPVSANYSGSQPAAAAMPKTFAARPAEPDWTRN